MRVTKNTNKFLAIALLLAMVFARPISGAFAATTTTSTSLNVNVEELLTVQVQTPDSEWASGSIGEFLRNFVYLSVATNNPAGFTASMTMQTTNTSLINTTKNIYTLPTLNGTAYPSGVAQSSFPANYWGYSTDDEFNNDVPIPTSTYRSMVPRNATPITILSSQTAGSDSINIVFGAKSDATLASGTYSGTVVISVVTGTITNDNPITPTDPVTPTPSVDGIAIYDSGSNITHYTETDPGNTWTQVSPGDNRGSYVPPQGVSTVSTGATLATGLGIATAIAATSGVFFLAAARREGEDDDEEQPEQ